MVFSNRVIGEEPIYEFTDSLLNLGELVCGGGFVGLEAMIQLVTSKKVPLEKVKEGFKRVDKIYSNLYENMAEKRGNDFLQTTKRNTDYDWMIVQYVFAKKIIDAVSKGIKMGESEPKSVPKEVIGFIKNKNLSYTELEKKINDYLNKEGVLAVVEAMKYAYKNLEKPQGPKRAINVLYG